MTNRIIIFLQNNSITKKKALQKNVEGQVRSRKDELWKWGETKTIHPSLCIWPPWWLSNTISLCFFTMAVAEVSSPDNA